MQQDTIAAISTAWGEAGVAMVRLSGDEACKIASCVVKPKKSLDEAAPRKMQIAKLIDKEAIDEVLVVRFAAPKSYTGEDIVEIHTHGGTLVAQICLEMLIRAGARMAEPGEFTKRAFLNGRIDLSQAEGVLGIIRSRSEEALRAAARTLNGELSLFVRDIYDELLNLQASVEVGLDFPEEDTPYIEDSDLYNKIETLKMELEDLLDRCKTGYLLHEGIRVAIVGRPNVGKSSLLNALLKQARAIVTGMPGTTRDVIEEAITWRGVPIRLVDTAGIRVPTNEAEAAGITKSYDELTRADICLWVLDSSHDISEQDILPDGTLERIRGCTHIFVLNKCDLPKKLSDDYLSALFPASSSIYISAKEGIGINELKEQILETANSRVASDGLNVTARQLNEIRIALEAINSAKDAVSMKQGSDIAATCLAQTRAALERLLGISHDDALLDKVFSNFCVGK